MYDDSATAGAASAPNCRSELTAVAEALRGRQHDCYIP